MAGIQWLRRGGTVAVCAPLALLALQAAWSTALMVHALHYLALLEFAAAAARALHFASPDARPPPPLSCANKTPTLFVSLGLSVGAAAHWGPSAVGGLGVLQ
jgi:hypothetical protein